MGRTGAAKLGSVGVGEGKKEQQVLMDVYAKRLFGLKVKQKCISSVCVKSVIWEFMNVTGRPVLLKENLRQIGKGRSQFEVAQWTTAH